MTTLSLLVFMPQADQDVSAPRVLGLRIPGNRNAHFVALSTGWVFLFQSMPVTGISAEACKLLVSSPPLGLPGVSRVQSFSRHSRRAFTGENQRTTTMAAKDAQCTVSARNKMCPSAFLTTSRIAGYLTSITGLVSPPPGPDCPAPIFLA